MKNLENNNNIIKLSTAMIFIDNSVENIQTIIDWFDKISHRNITLKIIYTNQNHIFNINNKSIELVYNSAYKEICSHIAQCDIGLVISSQTYSYSHEYKKYDLILENCFDNRKIIGVYTDLGLMTIDGSTTFVGNLCEVLENFKDKFRICLYHYHELNHNLIKIFSQKEIYKYKVKSSNILKLLQIHDITYIFSRCWNIDNIKNIIDNNCDRYKLVIYLPLELNDKFKLVNNFIYQTGYQLELLNSKYNFVNSETHIVRFSPGLKLSKIKKNQSTNLFTNLSPSSILTINYIGSLRKECYSNEMLTTMYNLLVKNPTIRFILAIGNMKNDVDKKLIDKIKILSNCSIYYQIGEEQIDQIYSQSNISLSFWENLNDVNQTLLSTKMMKGIFHNNIVIYKSPNNILDEYDNLSKYSIRDISELHDKIIEIKKMLLTNIIVTQSNKHLISNYSYEMNLYSMGKFIGEKCNSKVLSHYFNYSFDNIYGLYINDKEKQRLENIKNKHNIDIELFEGVNGSRTLIKEYESYSKIPLSTEWEKKTGRKRLSIGGMGHHYSFISIIKDAKNNGYKKILVLEGDVLIHNDIFTKFIDFKKNIPDYKILYLGAGKWNPNVVYHDNYYLPNETTGTFAISFDSSLYDELLTVWSEFVNPTDVCLWQLHHKYPNECFVINPNIIICKLEDSSIQMIKNRSYLYDKFDWAKSKYN